MRMPDDFARHAAAFLHNHFDEALARPDSLTLTWPLQPPTAAGASADTDAVRAFIREWQHWPHPHEVETVSRRWTREGLGTQEVPVRVTVTGAPRIADASGLGPQLRDAAATAQLIVAAFPAEPDFATAVYRSHKQWRDLNAYDTDCLIECLIWLRANPDSGLWQRAVPVEGVDGKWIGSHRGLLRTLLAPFGITDLGLRTQDATLRLRYLNHAPHLPDISIPFPDAHGLFPAPPQVVIVENKETFLALPPLSDAAPPTVLLFGAGYAAEHLPELPWLHGADIAYWGDLDADGFRILSRLRAGLPDTTVRSVLMDPATVEAHRHLAVKDPQSTATAPSRLTADEHQALHLLFTAGGLRIEQERIPFTYALEELGRAFRSPD